MTAGNVFFLICATVALLGALSVVVAQSPIRSAVGLLATILGIAGLFLLLSAQFLAALQVLVYAGAVVVLFVFVIMLLGTDGPTPVAEVRAPRGAAARWVGAGFAAALGGLLLYVLGAVGPAPVRFAAAPADHGTVEQIGTTLYRGMLVPFELATLLLLAAIVGAIGVARSRVRPPTVSEERHETRRLFAGPVHPRDAGRPLGPTDQAPAAGEEGR